MLLDNGVQPGQLTAFYMQNSVEFIFALLGLWAIGSASALINYNLGKESLIHSLRISGARVLLVEADSQGMSRIEEARERIEGELGMKIVVLDGDQKARISIQDSKTPEANYLETLPPDFPICMIYTSGSTGMPKACKLTLARVFFLLDGRIRTLGLSPGPNGDRLYNCMPMYHGAGCVAALLCLCSGLTLCIGKKFSSTNFWNDVRDSDATAFVYVGETARYLLATPPSPLDKQHRVKLMFGNGLRPDVWRKFVERFRVEIVCESFNSTEGLFALANRCCGEFSQGAVGHHGLILRRLLHHVYVPVEVDYITGDIYRDARSGFARRKPYEDGGEILVRVPDEKAFTGYWNDPNATAKKFERNVFKEGDLFYRTGDALRRTSDGRWFFIDRLGDTYRWKSENVSTAEVSEILGRYPGVMEAIVYGVEVPGYDGRAGCAALYVAEDLRSATFYASLLSFAQKVLPNYAVPVFLRITNSMQPMHNNKQNKRPLKEEGINIRKIARGMSSADKILWHPEALGAKGRGGTYVEFTEADLGALTQRAMGLQVAARL